MDIKTACTDMKFESLNQAISHWAVTKPDALALTHTGADGSERVLTFSELNKEALALGCRLASVCERGDRALLVFEQGLDYVVAFLACSYSGIVAVTGSPPDELRKGARLDALLEDSGAELIITNKEAEQTLERNHSTAQVRRLLTDHRTQLSLDAPVCAKSDDLMFLQYTSGSTSEPKGVMLTHGSINANLSIIVSHLYAGNGSVGVSWLPLYHDMGLILMVLGPLYAGRPAHLMSPSDFLRHPHRWLDLVSRVRGTVTAAPDFAYRLCQDRVSEDAKKSLDLTSVRMMINGSEPIRLDNMASFYDTFSECGLKRSAIIGGYGMAELGVYASTGPILLAPLAFDLAALESDQTVLACSPDTVGNRKIASCGKIESPGLDVRIVDPERLTELGADKVGEIWLAGPSVGAGYWENPKATRSTFGGMLDGSSQRYLRTGDLGFLHDGNIHICGRIKEVIIIRGRNVFPSDICAVVESEVEAMRGRRAAAFGVAGTDGEEIVILCAAKVGPDTYHAVAKRITAALSAQIGIVPSTILFVQNRDLKRTTSGKVRHSALKKDYLAGLIEADFEVHNQQPKQKKATEIRDVRSGSEAPEWIVQRICDTCATVCECDLVGHDEDLLERGLDSLRGLKLVVALEGHFHGGGKALCLCDIVELKTPRRIAHALVASASSTESKHADHFVELSI